MSQEALAKVVERASTDPEFRAELQRSPDSALKGYDLTVDERAAVMSGDTSQLGSLGVDARVTKVDGGVGQSIINEQTGAGPEWGS